MTVLNGFSTFICKVENKKSCLSQAGNGNMEPLSIICSYSQWTDVLTSVLSGSEVTSGMIDNINWLSTGESDLWSDAHEDVVLDERGDRYEEWENWVVERSLEFARGRSIFHFDESQGMRDLVGVFLTNEGFEI